MPRIKRKKLKFNEESVNELLQELYNDTHSIKSEIKALFGAWRTKVNEPNEIAVLGKSIIDLINSEIKNEDIKLTLFKQMKEIVYREDKADSGKKDTINTDEKSDLLQKVKEEMNKNKK